MCRQGTRNPAGNGVKTGGLLAAHLCAGAAHDTLLMVAHSSLGIPAELGLICQQLQLLQLPCAQERRALRSLSHLCGLCRRCWLPRLLTQLVQSLVHLRRQHDVQLVVQALQCAELWG